MTHLLFLSLLLGTLLSTPLRAGADEQPRIARELIQVLDAYAVYKMGDFDSQLAKVTNEAEVKIAAEYFSKLKYKPWVKVVETKTVAKTRIIQGMHAPIEGTSEPIGTRMLEMPVNTELTELRDSQSSFIAYVPIGAVKRGEALATKANAKTTQCAICHGQGLKGLGDVPRLAGRSPYYVIRQLKDIQSGARKGSSVALMQPVVKNLSDDDIINLASYIVSLNPS